MENADSSNRRNEMQLSLNAIADNASSWLSSVQKRETKVRLVSSFLTASLVLAAVGIAFLAYFFSQGQLSLHNFSQNQITTNEKFLIFSVGISAAVVAVASGIATYFLLKKKQNEELKGLSSLISEMNNKMSQQQYEKQTNGDRVGFMADVLALADKIVAVLPELIRKGNHDAILFGIVAFMIANAVSHNPAAAVIVGVAVWLFFRYEAKKTLDRDMSKVEEQRKVFEQRKKDFLDSL